MTINYSKILKIQVILIVFSCISLYAQDDFKEQLLKLNQAVKTAHDKHLTDVEAKVIIDAAIKGIINKLDPHSYYFTSEEMQRVEARRTGNLFGIGINYYLIQDTAAILSVYRDGPAYKAGLKTGDKIIKVNSKDIIKWKSEDIDYELNGDKSQLVYLDIIPYGKKQPINISLKRQKIPTYSVDASFLLDGTDIGYIAINRFMATTHIEMTDSLSLLSDMGMKKLIIDLRGNPGGILEQAYLTADEFIPDGNTILMTRGKDPIYNETYKSSKNGKYENIPLILIVDSETASAPEIFAGAIQDLDRGLLLGETTFGKGLVQKPYPFFDGSELWLTVAKYYTPTGRSIQKEYEGNSNYGTLADRIVLKDGMNISHSVELSPEYGYNNELPVYKTKNGRSVVGGGGITPDYVLKNDTLTNMTNEIVHKNLIQKTAVKIYNKYLKQLKLLYEDDFMSYLHNFTPSDNMVCDLLNFALERGIDYSETDLSADREYLKILIKANIAGMIWDNSQSRQVLIENSKQIRKAVELMPMAERIVIPK
jgi:carboxyl-terminal processing protease